MLDEPTTQQLHTGAHSSTGHALGVHNQDKHKIIMGEIQLEIYRRRIPKQMVGSHGPTERLK